jgi:hypothetical protein
VEVLCLRGFCENEDVPPTEDLSREELVAMLALRGATIAG